ncbi:MAG: valine--tRNA ligase [Euryarchaeota archaeon]|nr:valine--tRNA ligase [Euryarchaeota archaeon]
MAGNAMPEPLLKETAWSVELEKSVADELTTHQYEPTWRTAPREPKVFAIDTPPPYPSGRWHVGAVAHYALIDVIARSRRMMGEKVLFPWGLDRNGINIELTVEKKFNRKMHTFPREEFLELCRKEIEQIGNQLVAIAHRVGMSCDFANPYATDSPEYRALSQRIFIELWQKGFIVEDLRPNNYCPDCRTTIADAEVYYEERDTTLYHVKWDLEKPVGGRDHLVIATTRPELMAACQIVLVNPDDERYRGLAGSKVRIPTYDRLVPVRAHPTVDASFGTGAMMICSYGDFTDVALFRELSLQPINAIGQDGLMTEAGGHLKGIHVKKARVAQVEKLKAEGRIVKEEPKKQKFPICERSKTPVELIQLKEWYVKQVDYVADLKKAAHEMEFHPDKHRQILLDWIDTVTIDWPISRRRYYHTEIPVWYCKKCRTPHVPKPGPYYQPWKQKAPPEIAKCSKCGHGEMEGEEKVFDTWMDSSSSQFYVLHYQDDRAWFAKNYPCTVRCNGRDIIRTWLHYSSLKSQLLLGKAPYEHVWISGLGMDEKGRKMSKSLGNVIDPDEVLNEFGADAFRFWAASDSTTGDDFRISKDRISGARKFLSKVHNVSRFVSAFPVKAGRPATLDPTDQWILAEANKLIAACRDAYAGFDFFTASNKLRDFVWNLFAPHYLEMAKRRAYAGDASARWTLHTVLRAVLLLLAPISPFLPYTAAKQLYGIDVHRSLLPQPITGVNATLADKTPLVESFNSQVWKAKKEKGIPLSAPLSGVEVPAELSDFRRGFVEMHNLQG